MAYIVMAYTAGPQVIECHIGSISASPTACRLRGDGADIELPFTRYWVHACKQRTSVGYSPRKKNCAQDMQCCVQYVQYTRAMHAMLTAHALHTALGAGRTVLGWPM